MHAHLAELRERLAGAIAGISPVELTWHPVGKWSVVEIIEHLYLTYTGTVKGFERVLKSGTPQAADFAWKKRVQAWVVVRMGYLPEGRKSPPVARPRGLPQEEVVPGILPAIERMDEVIARCESELLLRGKVLDHPILGALSGNEWRKFHLVHGRHHIRQISRLRAAARKS